MESQPQNPEFRINPENFHPCTCVSKSFNKFCWSQSNCLGGDSIIDKQMEGGDNNYP